MALSQAHQEAYARAQSDVRHLLCVELRHSQFPNGGVIRQVNFDQDVTITLEPDAPINAGQAVLFAAEGMNVEEPEISIEPDNSITLTLDGTSGLLSPHFYNAMQFPETIFATVRPIGYNITTASVIGVVGALNLEVSGVAVNLETVVLTMGYLNPSNQDFPGIDYTPTSHPGLYV